jgi:dihydrofolate reductase
MARQEQSRQRSLSSFMQLSLDGYYCDAKSDMSFAKKAPDDTEWNEFTASNASGGGMLLFGRVTYEMMVKWWPTPAAAQAMPEVAAGMNAMPKLVFSRTLRSAEWSNTTLIRDDLVGTVRRLRNEAGPDIVILGSGSVVTQLADAGLIDRFQVVVNPVALGAGKPYLGGLAKRVDLNLSDSRVFRNGSVVLWYSPR